MNPDENILAARAELATAIGKLCSVRIIELNGHRQTTPCLYAQLSTAVHGTSEGIHPGAPAPTAPGWIAAISLLHTIDRHAQQWTGDRGHTLSLLRKLEDHRWRPQDAPHVTSIAKQVTAWAEEVQQLLTPETRLELTVPCPDCGAEHGYRHIDGEDVRSRALIVTSKGAHCLACNHHWPPHLLGLLGLRIGRGEKGPLNDDSAA